SEEHTSELQSRFDLVCRLLLEKKKASAQRNASSRLIFLVKQNCAPSSKACHVNWPRPFNWARMFCNVWSESLIETVTVLPSLSHFSVTAVDSGFKSSNSNSRASFISASERGLTFTRRASSSCL